MILVIFFFFQCSLKDSPCLNKVTLPYLTNTLCYLMPQIHCSAIDCMPKSVSEEMGLKRKGGHL